MHYHYRKQQRCREPIPHGKADPLTEKSLLRGAASKTLMAKFCRQRALCRELKEVLTAMVCRE
jgi:hypothetical protein